MIEVIRAPGATLHPRVVLFDFDGTLSLIRSGWMDVMVPMMVEVLAHLKTGESTEELRTIVEDFVWRLTGKETIYQMIALAEAISARGGKPLSPLEYKRMYLDLLGLRICGRLDDLRGGADPDRYLVPGARALLERLAELKLKMFLASGTDEVFVKVEARLLDIERYFDGGVYGALDDYRSFSKKMLIERILSTKEYLGGDFLGFGDGYVEIEEVKRAGGTAIGVATDEPDCLTVDKWKRQRLIGAGADYIVPNYLAHDELMAALFPA